MPIRVSQADFIKNWQQGTQQGQQKYTQGVQNSGDWAGQTVAALPQMIAALNDAYQSGRTAQGITDLGTANWRNITVAKAANWYAGVTSSVGVANMQKGATKLYGMLNTALSAAEALPRGSLSQNLARANAFATSMYNQKRGL